MMKRQRYLWIIVISVFFVIFALSACSKTTNGISGRITSGGSGLSGVTVTLSGADSRTCITDSNGNYSFSDLEAGSYRVTPALAGYRFSPAYRNASLDGSDGINFNFSAIVGSLTATTQTVYLKSDGTVWAWGDNGSGQLGNGTTTDSAVPLQVAGLTGVTVVSAGRNHTVALKGDGTWGNNDSGQLGDGTTSGRTAPVQAGGLTDVIAVAAGSGDTVALRSDGTVWTWGNNSSGQLGDGTTTNRSTPVQVSSLTGATGIAVGYDHTVALKSDGTVWAWGNNSNGQLGNGTTTNSSSPVQSSGLSLVAGIAAGTKDTFALKTDGTVRAWGINGSGQLGIGTTTDSAAPVQISRLGRV
jgi:hypothetical protein